MDVGYNICLKFGLSLSSLEDIVKLGCEHYIAPCLEFPRHECLLAVQLHCQVINQREGIKGRVETCLATRQVNEDVISKNNRDISFGRGFSLIHGPSLLCVNCPCSCLPVFGDLELENAVGLDSDHGQGPSGNEEF